MKNVKHKIKQSKKQKKLKNKNKSHIKVIFCTIPSK